MHLLKVITVLLLFIMDPKVSSEPAAYSCRLGNDKGRSVSAWGFWGDILNSPFHSFGTACEERIFFKISNKQFVHTSVAVAEYNVMVNTSVPAKPHLTGITHIAHHLVAFAPGTWHTNL